MAHQENALSGAAAAPVSASEIPRDALRLIPDYNGDTKVLSFFLKKCEFVISRYQGTADRNEYIMQAITSKLTGKAAALISERGEFTTYTELKALLVQHFGDPRSEECVAIELETIKIKNNESYLEFCSRIQNIRSVLLSKVNQGVYSNEVKKAKHIIYNNTSLNVFLYNLPEHMVRLVRIKNPTELEEALKYVLEEVNFQEQYNLRSKMLRTQPIFQLQNPNKFPLPERQFKFGIPHPQGLLPKLGQNFKPFGFANQQGVFGYKSPNKPQGPPGPHQYPNDVTMRTAPMRPQQVPVNELDAEDLYTGQYDDSYYYDGYVNYDGMYTYDDTYIDAPQCAIENDSSNNNVTDQSSNKEHELKSHMDEVVKKIEKLGKQRKTILSDSDSVNEPSPICISDSDTEVIDREPGQYHIPSDSSSSGTVHSGLNLESKEKMGNIKEKVQEKRGVEKIAQFEEGQTIFAIAVNKRQSKDKPKYQKAKVLSRVERNIVPIKSWYSSS
ncbi:Cytadhesion [Operophtera brumata]|uniref:Cytadhesion n=1 Tax=Operophtera brumata TaxID=104452 RepID=A0A0L7K4L0_OPEBR|nr:Cytadhesion [Operophtera brumata]